MGRCIIRALDGNNNKQSQNKAYNCLWKYKESNSYPTNIEPFKRKKEKPIFHYTKDGELIEYYRTLKEAESITGIPVKKLKYMSYNGDLRRHTCSICRTDYWSRTAFTAQ